ncbi:MAG: ABC transporter ATP-binding protein [Clostridia bacterium]|nr:ABC transporter ATP-binding protein [Clostridia bacterium]
MPLLELKDIERSFVNGQVRTDVLKGICLNVEEGEYISIMGPSGSGKSTLLNIIGCLDRASSGSYLINGKDVGSLGDNALADLRNHEIGFVFQSFHLLKDLNAMANVELPLIYRGVPAPERHKAAKEVLEIVGLAHRINHYPKQLSGGEQQRVAIARSIIGNPRVLLADEPTGALDSKTSVSIMDLFNQLNTDMGLTIVQVTHDTEVAYYGSRVIHIFDGEVDAEETVTSERREQALKTLVNRSKNRRHNHKEEDDLEGVQV